MICIPADSAAYANHRKQIVPSSVDFAAREEVILKLEEDYDVSLGQLDELNARLENCLSFLTGKPATLSIANTPSPLQASTPQATTMHREAA